MTGNSSHGRTVQRLLIHVDTDQSKLLVNNRFAYVSVSGPQHEADIYSNDGSNFPAASIAKVFNLRRPKWINSQLHPGLN